MVGELVHHTVQRQCMYRTEDKRGMSGCATRAPPSHMAERELAGQRAKPFERLYLALFRPVAVRAQ